MPGRSLPPKPHRGPLASEQTGLMRDHRGLDSPLYAEFPEHFTDVAFDGRFGEKQLACDPELCSPRAMLHRTSRSRAVSREIAAWASVRRDIGPAALSRSHRATIGESAAPPLCTAWTAATRSSGALAFVTYPSTDNSTARRRYSASAKVVRTTKREGGLAARRSAIASRPERRGMRTSISTTSHRAP